MSTAKRILNELNLDNPAQAARMDCLARVSEILADYEHLTRRARYVQEHGERMFRAGEDRGLEFQGHLFHHLQYQSLDAYEDFESEDTLDLDAADTLLHCFAPRCIWMKGNSSLARNRTGLKK